MYTKKLDMKKISLQKSTELRDGFVQENNKPNFVSLMDSSKYSEIGVDIGTAILAGNSRVSIGLFGEIVVEPQLFAFKAGLICALEIYQKTNHFPQISVAFDHKGIFRKQFLKDGLSNSQKRNPKMSDLKQELVGFFEPIANIAGVPLNVINVIHEDSARSHAGFLIKNGDLAPSVKRWMQTKTVDREECNDDERINSCAASSGTGPKITCAAITCEYYLSSVKNNAKILKVFIENSPWSKLDVYVRGAMLSKEMKTGVEIQINLVNNVGVVIGSSKLRS